VIPIIPINWLASDGFPVRNDNLTNFAYLGSGDGLTPPEVYSAYRPDNASDPTPIMPGETTYLRNTQTGKYCRLAQLPAAYPLKTGPAVRTRQQLAKKPPPSPKGPVVRTRLTSPKASSSGLAAGRHLLQTPSSCATQGVLCDQDSAANAAILTYTGTGMSYQGTPLVLSPVTRTLLLSADPACTSPTGGLFTFPPATMCKLA
jgi:hypothetical protein